MDERGIIVSQAGGEYGKQAFTRRFGDVFVDGAGLREVVFAGDVGVGVVVGVAVVVTNADFAVELGDGIA